MPTPARRRERMFESRATVVLVATMLILVLLGFARIYTVTQDLKHEQTVACQLRVKGRADTNAHDRTPLRAALSYLGNALVQAAEKQTDGRRKASTAAFGEQLLAYAETVKPLPNPTC